jgi:hypothetical protein
MSQLERQRVDMDIKDRRAELEALFNLEQEKTEALRPEIFLIRGWRKNTD